MQFGSAAQVEWNIIPVAHGVTDIQQAEFCFIYKAKTRTNKPVVNIYGLVPVFYKAGINEKKQIGI